MHSKPEKLPRPPHPGLRSRRLATKQQMLHHLGHTLLDGVDHLTEADPLDGADPLTTSVLHATRNREIRMHVITSRKAKLIVAVRKRKCSTLPLRTESSGRAPNGSAVGLAMIATPRTRLMTTGSAEHHASRVECAKPRCPKGSSSLRRPPNSTDCRSPKHGCRITSPLCAAKMALAPQQCNTCSCNSPSPLAPARGA